MTHTAGQPGLVVWLASYLAVIYPLFAALFVHITQHDKMHKPINKKNALYCAANAVVVAEAVLQEVKLR